MGLSIFDKFGLSECGDAWRAPGTIKFLASGDLDDYISFSTTDNKPLITGVGNYLVLGKDGTAGSATSVDDILVGGKLEVDGILYADSTSEFTGGVTFGTTITPATNDGAALGTGSLKWSDLFLADGGVINFNNGDVTMTHSANMLTVASTWSTINAVGQQLVSSLTTDVRLGSYVNAIYGYVDLQATGGVTGLLGAICAEVVMPTGLSVGTIACLELELTCPSSGFDGSRHSMSYIFFNTTGTTKEGFNDYGVLLHFDAGNVAATGNIVGAGYSTLRIGFGQQYPTLRYIPLSTAEASFATAYPIISTSTTGFATTATFVPDSGRTNYAYSIGNRTTELTVNLDNAASQNFEPFQMNINLTATAGAPTSTSTARLLRIRSTHDTADMANLRIMNINTDMDVQKNIQAAYGQMNGVDFTTNTLAITTEAAVGVFNMECTSTVTGNVRGIIVNLYGATLPSTSIGLEVRTDGGAATLAEGIRVWSVGSCSITTGIDIRGTVATGIDMSNATIATADITLTTNASITSAGTISLKVSGDTDDYITFGTNAENVPTIYGTGAYLRIGDAGTTNHSLNSEDDLMVTGELEVKGTTFIDGNLSMGEVGIILNHAIGTNQYYSGITITGVAGETVAKGEILMLQTDDQWDKAQADTVANGYGMLGLCVVGNTAGNAIVLLLKGFYYDTGFSFGNGGQPLYLCDTGAGDFDATIPDDTNEIVRIVGYQHDDQYTVYFNPDGAYVTVA